MRAFARSAVAIVAVAAVLTTAGCTAGGSNDIPEGQTIELDFWSWVPNIDKAVDLWNEENPQVQVRVNAAAQGDEALAKLLTAAQAGSGLPDITLAEFQTIPLLVVNNVVADIAEYIPDDTASYFSEGDWSSATLGGDAVYGIPEDTGPMMFYYRQDVFDSLGLSAPTTWDEYAEAARAVHNANPNQWLGTFSADDSGQWAGLSQQAGASWWSTDGETWSVNINSDETKQVLGYWGGLVEEGVIDNKPQYTPEWNAGLNDGTQIGWVGAAWGPGVLAGNAADTAGLWAMAPLPQWDPANPATGAWGGSVNAVTSQTEYPQQASDFVVWLDTDPEAVALLASESGVFPSATEVAAPALTQAPPFFPEQPDFWSLAAEISVTMNPFTYGPNLNVAYSAYNDEMGKAAESKKASEFLAALDRIQKITLDDLEASGFAVSK